MLHNLHPEPALVYRSMVPTALCRLPDYADLGANEQEGTGGESA